MGTTTIQPVSAIFNLYTSGHGDYDHCWDDYIDYSEEKGVVFSSHDYTYGLPSRDEIRTVGELTTELTEKARQDVTNEIIKIGRIFEAGMWIGSSNHNNYNIPCKIVRSHKFRGEATLINIASKRDLYNREIYKALIVGSDNLKYYVSPNCVKVDKEAIMSTLAKLSLNELLEVLDESKYGHWNFHPYNLHLFSFPRLLERYASTENKINIRSCDWAWKAALKQEEAVE